MFEMSMLEKLVDATASLIMIVGMVILLVLAIYGFAKIMSRPQADNKK